MSDVVRASGTVHWIGAGLSTGSGLALVVGVAGPAVAEGLHGSLDDVPGRRRVGLAPH